MALWTLTLNLDGTVSADGLSLHYAPLTLTVPADTKGPAPIVNAGDVTGSYTATFQDLPDAGTGTISGSTISDPELTLTRRLDLGDPSLAVTDDSSQADQPVGTIRLRGDIALPDVQYNIQYPNLPAQVGHVQAGVPMQIDISYDPSQSSQTFSVQTGANAMRIVGTAKGTIKRAATELIYTPLATDMIGTDGVSRGSTYTSRPTHFFASDAGGGCMIHGNSSIAVMLDGSDVGSRFSTNRWQREQSWALKPDGSRGAVLEPSAGFIDDHPDDSPSWSDVPGAILPKTKMSTATRTLQEYLVSARRYPEFGFLYFIVVVEYRARQYRVRMSNAWSISAQDWIQIKSSAGPYKDETSGGPFPIDSGWTTVN
jgi:hypothetical protein